MKRICAWCKKDLGSGERGKKKDLQPISHGICPDCVRKNLAHESVSMEDFLDQFSHPVYLVDADVRIITANKEGLAALNKKQEEITGRLGGHVFNCARALLPGGCGKTVHCKGCTIRNTVIDTYKTGISHVNVPAFPDLHHITLENRFKFLISTEKTGDTVLLRIDEI